MKSIAVIPFCILLGCGPAPQTAEPVQPPVTDVKDPQSNGSFYNVPQDYTPGLKADSRQEVCQVDTVTLSEDWTINAIPVPTWGWTEWTHLQDEEVLLDAEHVHLRGAKVMVAAGSPSGSFVRAVTGYQEYGNGEPLFWSGQTDPEQYDIVFEVDGSQDLAPYVFDGTKIRFIGDARVSAPKLKTRLKIEATVDIWKNCQYK